MTPESSLRSSSCQHRWAPERRRTRPAHGQIDLPHRLHLAIFASKQAREARPQSLSFLVDDVRFGELLDLDGCHDGSIIEGAIPSVSLGSAPGAAATLAAGVAPTIRRFAWPSVSWRAFRHRLRAAEAGRVVALRPFRYNRRAATRIRRIGLESHLPGKSGTPGARACLGTGMLGNGYALHKVGAESLFLRRTRTSSAGGRKGPESRSVTELESDMTRIVWRPADPSGWAD